MYRMGRLALLCTVVGLAGLALAGCHTSAPKPAKSVISTPSETVAATASPALSVPGTHKSATAYRVSLPVSAVVVTSHVGDVTVIGSAGSATVVTQQVAYSSKPPVTSRTISGGTLTVTYRCPVQPVCGVAYVIQVPRDVTVRAATGTGAIRLTGLAGNVTAKADVGDISATGLTGNLASLTCDVGGISATFTATPTTVEAFTRVGGITLHVPGLAAYRVTVHDDLGRATVSVRQSAVAPHVITATADVGAVLVAPLA
jgi:hypothetical protein